MSPIVAEMMRSNLSPDEASVSAIIAQYLIENSQTFKELTEIRAEVRQKKIGYRGLGSQFFRAGTPLKAINFSKIAVQSRTTPTESKRRAFSG
jgi:hypothetical protein